VSALKRVYFFLFGGRLHLRSYIFIEKKNNRWIWMAREKKLIQYVTCNRKRWKIYDFKLKINIIQWKKSFFWLNSK
jgi:hypothetical protein